jgi:hypothetical protein
MMRSPGFIALSDADRDKLIERKKIWNTFATPANISSMLNFALFIFDCGFIYGKLSAQQGFTGEHALLEPQLAEFLKTIVINTMDCCQYPGLLSVLWIFQYHRLLLVL